MINLYLKEKERDINVNNKASILKQRYKIIIIISILFIIWKRFYFFLLISLKTTTTIEMLLN
jgi:capsular polysaccharide biosynthesis protein